MLNLTSLIFLCALAGIAKAEYCQDNFSVNDLPGGIQEEAITILLTGTLANFVGCPGNISVPDEDVKFWFYSRSNPEVPILLDQKNPTQVDSNKPTKVLVPGWLCNVTNDRMPALREAYLQREDCNVIGIDWTARSIDLYSNAFCSIPNVAKIVGAFLCTLNTALNIDLQKQVHIVGHSMGGQISGLSGQEVQKQCNKMLGRITAMDPAGPLYQTSPKSERLDASDATFVDVIHTNQAYLGFYGSCGDVDFFPNCGTYQPGCLKIDGSTSIDDIMKSTMGSVGCNHVRSCDYMVESIYPANKNFTGTSCLRCPGLPTVGICVKDIINKKYTLMGEDCPSNPPAAKFYLETNDESPFAQG